MSHKATNWLAGLSADLLTSSEFRILFHLCDCHNPAAGCFPTQAYLKANTGVSNGTVNNALNGLEEKGLIKRKTRFDPETKRRKSTLYVLGFEVLPDEEPTPKTGDGNKQKPTPKTGDGANSNLGGGPSPIKGKSRLQPTGDKPVKEPVNNLRDAPSEIEISERDRGICQGIANGILEDRHVPSFLPQRQIRAMIAEKMISAERLAQHGFVAIEIGGAQA